MSTNAEEFRSSFERARARAVGDLLEAIVDVQRWRDQHDHPVAEWFQGGESA